MSDTLASILKQAEAHGILQRKVVKGGETEYLPTHPGEASTANKGLFSADEMAKAGKAEMEKQVANAWLKALEEQGYTDDPLTEYRHTVHAIADDGKTYLFRVDDGWGEWYVVWKSGKANWIAQKMPDVSAYQVSKELSHALTKPKVHDLGWGDKAWDKFLADWLKLEIPDAKWFSQACQAEKQHAGAMLALYPDTPPTFTLADSDLEPTAPDELHVTMAYLGDAADLDEEDRAFLRRVCEQIASEFEPIQAKLGGIGRFLNLEDDDTQAYYASVDSPDIETLRARLVEVLGALGLLPDADHGFTPHMTLAYVPVGKPAAGAGLQEEPVEFGGLSLSLGGERERFPFKVSGAKQNIMLTYPDESKTQRFVWQQHFRGKSAHGDFRVQSGDYLVGWTIPDQNPGAITEPVETLAQANAAVANPDLWKMNLATGEIKPREIRSGVVRKGDLRALPKGVEIPEDWLNEQGVTDKPDPGEAIPVGATRNFPGVFKIVDKGMVEHGAKKPWLAEYWIHGDKWGTQRWLFRLLERNKENDDGLQAEGWQEEAEEVNEALKYEPGQARDESGRFAGGGGGGEVVSKPTDRYREGPLYSVQPGQTLAQDVLKSEGLVLMAPDVSSEIVVSPGQSNRSHASIIQGHMGKTGDEFDKYVKGRLELNTKDVLYLKVNSLVSGIGRDLAMSGQEDDVNRRAERNLKKLARAMINAGYPSDMPVRWQLAGTQPDVRTTLDAFKSLLEVSLEELATGSVFKDFNREKQDTLPPGVIEQQPRSDVFWVFMQPDDQTPYVLGKEAVDKDWLPPKGVSALPKAIRERVPKELRYWEVSGKEALDRRAKLAEMDIRELGGSSAKQLDWKPYVLQRHWFRGPIQVRFGASDQHYDLRIVLNGKHWHLVIDGNPLTNDRLPAYEETKYSGNVATADGKKINVLRIGTDPVELAPGQPANPTKDTPAFIQTVDEGEARVIDDQPEFKKVEFKDGKLKGAWYFRLESADSKIGEFGKSEGPQVGAKYEPGQARDESGRFASGGGGGASPISVKHSNLSKGVTRSTYSLDKVKGSELQVVKRPDGSRSVATFLVPESERRRGYGQQLLLRALKDGPIATESSGGVSEAYRRVQQSLVRKGQVVIKPDEYNVSYMHLAKKGEKGVRPLFGSSGGKRLLAKTIVDLIPEHKVYVEPFAGGAAVLFAKPPEMSEKEVLADADPDIAFAYRTVKGLSDAEIAELAKMDWEASETKWKSLKDSTPSSKAGKLHKFLYLNAYSKGDRRSYRHWYDGDETSVAERMPLVRDRMKNVKVLSQDYREVLKAHDSPNTFFYLDPPYPDTGNLSEWNFDADAFEKTLMGLKGKVLVSWSPKSPKLDLKGWSQRSVKLQRSDQDRSEDTELLIANYPLPKRVRRKSMDDIEALQLVYTCSGCKGEFESEVVLEEPVCPDCASKALPWQPYLLQRHNDHHDLRIGDDFTLRLSGSLLDNEPDKAEVSTESATLQGADGQAVDALKVKPGDPVKLDDGEIQTLDKGQARYAKTQSGHQVEFKGGKLEGVYLFGPEGAHPVDLEHIDVEWEPGQPEPAEPDGAHPPLFPFEPPQIQPFHPPLIPLNPQPPVPPLIPPPGQWWMGDGEVAEGEKVGKRIKTEKLSKLQELRNSLESAVKWLGEVIGWASYQDAPEPTMLEFFKGSDAGFTVKTVQGEPWLFTWSANAFKDREGEIFSTKALENWADAATSRQDKGTFNFWHIPGSDFAIKRWVGVPGRILVEAGPFTQDAKGKAAQAFFAAFPDRHPTLAPEGWGCSVEYRYLPEERKKGIYQNVEITRTSVLPRFAAANTWTAVKEVTMALTDAQKKAAQELFGEDLAASILGEAEAKTKELEPNVAHKGDGEQTEPEPAPEVQPETAVAEEAVAEDDKAKKKPKDAAMADGEPYPKPTKAEKKQLDQFVKAIRDVAASVTDDSPGRTAILEVADKLSEENLKDMAGELKKAGKAVKNAAQKARLGKLVEAMAGDGTYPAPGEGDGEAYPYPTKSKEFVEEVAAEVGKQFKLDVAPIGEALTATAAALKGLEDRLAALETQSGRKAATDLPRFVFGLVEQASKADATIVPEGDKLLDQKPKETSRADVDGSIAAHFFPHGK